MTDTNLTLPADAHWIIVYKGDGLYALDCPVVSWEDGFGSLGVLPSAEAEPPAVDDRTEDGSDEPGDWRIVRLMDDKPIEAILKYVQWICNDCPE